MPEKFRGTTEAGALYVMQRTGLALCLALCVLASACASGKRTVVVWEKPGGSQAELEAARSECSEIPPPSPGQSSVRRDRVQSDALGAAFVKCMQEKGWTWRTRDLNAEPTPPGADQP